MSVGWPGKASRSADHEVVCGTAFQQKRWGRCLLGGLGEGQEAFGARARKPGGRGGPEVREGTPGRGLCGSRGTRQALVCVLVFTQKSGPLWGFEQCHIKGSHLQPCPQEPVRVQEWGQLSPEGWQQGLEECSTGDLS